MKAIKSKYCKMHDLLKREFKEKNNFQIYYGNSERLTYADYQR